MERAGRRLSLATLRLVDTTPSDTTPSDTTPPTPQRLSRDGSVHVTDERVNTVSHLAASCFALVGSALLISQAADQGDVWKVVGFSV